MRDSSLHGLTEKEWGRSRRNRILRDVVDEDIVKDVEEWEGGEPVQ